MSELSPLTQKLLRDFFRSGKSSFKEEGPFLEADEITVRVASFYEKIRGVIDWKGEHLLKRNAIERSLKRKIFSETALRAEVAPIPAEPFVTDLIRSGHFKSKRIAESKVTQVQSALDKYVYLLQKTPKNKGNGFKISFGNWLSAVAACEVEEILSESDKERALLSYAFRLLKKKIKIENEKEIKEEEKDLLLYIAVQQALFNLDSPIISYHILKFKYENWKNPGKEDLKKIAESIHKEKEEIDRLLRHPLLKKLYQLCKKKNTPYLIIGDILRDNPKKAKEILSDPEKAEKKIVEYYQKRVDKMKGRLYRAAMYTTVSIFITNVAALLAIEIPFSRYIGIGEFTPLVVAIDVLVPTLLMALLVITVSPPPEKNKKMVVLETMKVLYKREREDTHLIRGSKRKKPALYFAVSVFYAICFLISVGAIVWLLSLINFPLLSYFIFIIFLSLIAFAGVKIRERAKELYMIETKDNFLTVIVDLFALPVVQLGKWLTARWEKYNILSVFFTALLDMPFKFFIEILDHWRDYLKEKKEGIY